ncbi:hypothetical protein MPTK1_7g16230 [Marchantia polymorpha subsp. ruderalis]|uniref:HMA domain-containing protein n=2 Tax=Marchantia polymorpha TaxID=3197 RepID=A0A176WCQ2_MARPO|nr:hypothetical protein AXG93_3483s1030 [Marchantia polymorpha subsp. ruderalis]PTQ30509.1 hypothetical protein MARPO_0123s0004 [Marchantia polymorpha]BBN17687.1 hypothetical protein Mp_7g16230 [Marchantia polymorpha subsp. ruderalis]|eukprot:PTQ30509.1 hypothetical protein MARPO_0123s0004 [Marchantia polymorpha]
MMTFAESLFQKIPTIYYQLFYDECEPVWIINSEEVQLVENVPQYYPPLPDPPKPPPPPPKPEPPAPTVVRVPMCCDACEDRVYSTFKSIKGVEKINCDWTEQKVVVTGPVPQEEVLAACRKMFKHSEPWK